MRQGVEGAANLERFSTMGLYDRDYYRRGGRDRLGGISGLSVNTWIIIVNIVVFAMQYVILNATGQDRLTELGYFSTFKVSWEGRLEFWRFLTFQFLHASPVHVGMNMLGLYVFGSMVEDQLGRKKYLAFYLTCGVFGAFMYLLLNAACYIVGRPVPGLLFNDTKTPLIGASAGVLGVIMACAYIAPNVQVQLLFPPIPIRIKLLAYFYVGLAVLSLFFGGSNAGGEAAHLGGAAAGAFFIRNSHLLRDFFDVTTDSRKKRPGPARPRQDPTELRRQREDEEREVNRILDKVKAEGINSLTGAEKDVLARDTDARRTNR